MSPVINVSTMKGSMKSQKNALGNIIRANHDLGWAISAVCYPIAEIVQNLFKWQELVNDVSTRGGCTTYNASSIRPSHSSGNAHFFI